MAKRASQYVCQACGAVASKWTGRCESCGEWNAIIEEPLAGQAPGGLGRERGRSAHRLDFQSLDGPAQDIPRRSTDLGIVVIAQRFMDDVYKSCLTLERFE